MGERKVQCKYFPPDFDPKLLPKRHNFKDEQIKVRVMIPFTVCCSCCGEFIYRGTKFTTRKEDVQGEDYLGLKLFRFYFKCPNCLQEIVFKTDPKNSDYALEVGGTRNYEPWKQSEEIEALRKSERESEEKGDAMKALENRTLECKREMDILEGLEEIVDRNSRVGGITVDSILEQRKVEEKHTALKQHLAEKAEDEHAARAFAASKSAVLLRLEDDELETKAPASGFGFGSIVAQAPASSASAPGPGGLLLVRKRKPEENGEKKKHKKDKKDKKKSKEQAD